MSCRLACLISISLMVAGDAMPHRLAPHSAPMPVTVTTTVELNNGVKMPRLNLGTCCGSKPSVGLGPWLAAGGVGIDTAWDYEDEPAIKAVLASVKAKRSSVFITSKIPAGLTRNSSYDCGTDPKVALSYVETNLQELGVEYVDLVLLHGPCELAQPPVANPTASNNALWRGLEEALKRGLTRAIGVSNYKVPQLAALNGTTPQVNQCELSVNGSFHQPAVDHATIAYCQRNNIAYESYGALKGCPWSDAKTQAIAHAHGKSVAQVCLRWVIQQGMLVAAGTGANSSKVGGYAQQNLAIFSFALTDAEMAYLSTFARA